MLRVCLNGGVRRDEHPAVPVTATELAVDAATCVAAGAGAVHLHPRGRDERETLDAHWPVLRDALHRGLSTRIGLADTLTLPDGSIAVGKAELVAAAVALGAG